jgi:hypothetical protein
MSNTSLALSEYAIVRSSTLRADEIERIERTDLEVLEVAVRWGRTTLGVAHVKAGESLRIGEDDGGSIMIPCERLGVASFSLIEKGMLQIPATATGSIEREGDKRGVDELRALSSGVAVDKGARAMLVLAGKSDDDAITIVVSRVAAGNKTPRRQALKRGLFALAALSLFAHLGTAAAMAYAPGDSLDDDSAPLDRETSARMVAMNKAADMHETKAPEEVAGEKSVGGGETGGAHKGPSGLAGKPGAQNVDAAYAIKGPPETKEQRLANIRGAIESRNYGALGALASVFGNSGPIDPGSAFAESVGNKLDGYDGHIVGSHLGDGFGFNGLGMNGLGNGGDGWSDGLGLGVGPWMGHGPGVGGPGSGWCPEGSNCTGSTVSHIKHTTEVGHTIDLGTSEIAGGLPKEIVRRIVRANFPSIRQCYETGLRKNPELRGVVSTRFIIDTTGAVETASLSSSTLSDDKVSACVVSVFRSMSFPAPENGKALVTYPIDLQNN